MDKTGFAKPATAQVASIKPNAVPWDPKELEGRTCINCACYFESTNADNPKEFQGFCRRANSDVQQVRTQKPRLDKNNNAMMRDGVPVMDQEVIIGHVYKPMPREGTCFDGYRPKGTLPGETPTDQVRRRFAVALVPIIKQQRKQLPPELGAVLDAMLEAVLGPDPFKASSAEASGDAALNS